MLLDDDLNNLRYQNGFIALEGVNGAGKSSLMRRIVKFLEEEGEAVITTLEPGGSPIGSAVRTILLESETGTLSPLAEVFLFAADRTEHVRQLIKPELKQNKIVITDRYFYSTWAFQGYGRKLDLEFVQLVNEKAIDGLHPDFTILLDLDPETGLARAAKRRENQSATDDRDSFEEEVLSFHNRMRNGFLEIAAESRDLFLQLDASRSEEQLFEDTVPCLKKWLDKRRERLE